MPKVTLSFPTHDSLWSFKDNSKAINVAVTPKRNTITGPFSSEEVDIAVKRFKAVAVATISTKTSSIKHTETSTERPSFRSKFRQFLSVMNL
jgi:hypothetical protein